MKAKLRMEVLCGECNSQMQYHDNGKYVRCNNIKCSQRLVNYLAPTIELHREEKLDEAKKPKGKGNTAKK